MSPRLKSFLHPFYHYGAYMLAGVVIVVCVLSLGFKFWLMPNIDRFKPEVVAAASRALGRPVTLGGLEAGWAGINPRLTLRDLRLTGDGTLSLPSVEARFSWLSLALLEPRLSSLTLEQPRVTVRRDRAGVIYLAGIAVNVASAPNPFPDWLLRQPRILVRNAVVSWQDDMLGAPELRFTQARVYILNRFGHHRFAGVALPSDAAGRVELRGDLKGRSLRQIDAWSGQLYARVDAARFDTWGHWVPWAQKAVRRGTGSLRFWLDIDHGQARSLTGDTRLEDVAINISADEALPDLAFQSLAGRVGWTREFDERGQVNAHTFFVEHLRFAVAGENPSEPAAVRVRLTPDGHGGFSKVAVRASNLRLEALTAMTGALPLPRRGHDLIAVLNPRGLVESASGHWSGTQDYGLKLHVRDAGLNAYANLPGFSGLSARIQADQASGVAELSGRKLILNLDRVFRQALEFEQLDLHTRWRVQSGLTHLAIEEASFHNDDLAGTASGSMDLPAAGKPRLNIQAHLSHGDAAAVYRYLPYAVGHDAYEWVKRAIVAGHSEDTRLVLKGDLAYFPFDRGGGEFKVTVKMEDAVLNYANGWPRIDGVMGLLVFHDKSMSVMADSGRILGTRLGAVHARIPDLISGGNDLLLIDGHVAGHTQDFLNFIRQSPVNLHTGGFTEKMQADGDGELALSLRLPLRHIKESTLNGIFSVAGNRIDLGGELPTLEQISGSVSFSDDSVQARGLQTRVLGLPATLSFDSQSGGQIHAHLNGSVTAEALAPHLPAALARHLGGACNWQAEVRMGKQQNEIQIDSDLNGMALDLPPPLRKAAAQSVPLTITRLPGVLGETVVKASYGNLISLRADIPLDGPARIALHLSRGEAPLPGQAGISIGGALHTLDLDAWRGIDLGATAANGPELHEVNLMLGELRIANRILHDTQLGVHPAGRGWKFTLAGRELGGEVLTLPEPRGTRVIANFERLSLPEPAPDTPASENAAVTQSLTGIEVNALKFGWMGRELGELHLRLTPEKNGYDIERASLSLPEGRIEGRGMVSWQPRRPTRLNLNLEASDLGKALTRFGYPGSVKGGEASVSGMLTWGGGLEDFAISGLNGDFSVTLKKGQFLRVEPGAAKLLGILSLQALPRRIALDFRDIFSEGFAFDEITGDVHLERGSAYMRGLKMQGPAARVRMSGVVDLAGQSQNLRIDIQPRLEDTVVVAGALLGGPVVGLGALLANKILRNPIGQVASFNYGVTGTWSEPVIVKLKRQVTTP